jgi:hypothetical protein
MLRPATTVIIAICMLMMAGCTRSTDEHDTAAVTADDDGVIALPSTTPVAPSGLVFSDYTDTRRGKTLSAYDPASGQLKGVYQMPRTLSLTPGRAQFDVTMTKVVYTDDCKLRVAVLTGDTYEPTATEWIPQQEYGKERSCYRNPEFTEGKVRAQFGGAQLDSPYRLVAVDPENPTAPAVDQGPGIARKEEQFTIAGQNDTDVRVYTEDGAIDWVRVYGSLPLKKGEYLGDSYDYRCSTPLSDVSFLCVVEDSATVQPYGSVAVVTVNTASRKVIMKKVVAASESHRTEAFLSPDRQQIAIHDESGWYTTPFDGSAAPQPSQLSDQHPAGEPVFWS